MMLAAAFLMLYIASSAFAWECRLYSSNDRRYYSNLGCKVQCSFSKCTFCDEQECCVITKCPQTCLDDRNVPRKKGEEWIEPVEEDDRFKRICSCLPFSSIVPFGPDEKPSDGLAPYAKNCLLAGCELRKTVEGVENRIFVRPGDAVVDSNGKKCRCVNGTDPFIMDAVTLYHLSC